MLVVTVGSCSRRVRLRRIPTDMVYWGWFMAIPRAPIKVPQKPLTLPSSLLQPLFFCIFRLLLSRFWGFVCVMSTSVSSLASAKTCFSNNPGEPRVVLNRPVLENLNDVCASESLNSCAVLSACLTSFDSSQPPGASYRPAEFSQRVPDCP